MSASEPHNYADLCSYDPIMHANRQAGIFQGSEDSKFSFSEFSVVYMKLVFFRILHSHNIVVGTSFFFFTLIKVLQKG